ncbi:MAG: hypothetical protein QXW39_07345 [Candidatus Bathyarchaeia archaeon]
MAITGTEFREKYGLTHVVEKSISVTDKPTLLAPNNPNRFEVLISNLGSEPLYIGFSSTLSSTKSIKVPAGGGIMTMRVEEDGEIVCAEIWGLSTSVGTTAYVVEYEARK